MASRAAYGASESAERMTVSPPASGFIDAERDARQRIEHLLTEIPVVALHDSERGTREDG
jgi:hypothetical protein